MKLRFKMEYLKKIYYRYHKSTKKQKKQILDEFCQNCNYNRKYAIRLLNGLPPQDRHNNKRKRNYLYLNHTISILEAIWEASGYPWSVRLKATLPLWIHWARKHFNITPEVEKQLLSISPATIDRRLKNKKYLIRKRIYSSTRPGYLLKHQIPIKTDNWDVNIPGFLEVDLVSHGGNSESGDFIYSLNCTDIHTQWTETRAIMGKGQTEALKKIEEIKSALPFPLLGIDPDNDGAFINWHLKKFCDNNKIQFTRSRPYKKNDNAHIEQKNWTHIRKIFGYARYDSEQALQLMNDLYRNELRYFMNFFQPSVKLVKKIRIGSKIKKFYDKPKTPFQRLCECKSVNPDKIKELQKLFSSLDPIELSKTINKKLDKIWQLRTRKIKILKSPEERMNAEILKDLSNIKNISNYPQNYEIIGTHKNYSCG